MKCDKELWRKMQWIISLHWTPSPVLWIRSLPEEILSGWDLKDEFGSCASPYAGLLLGTTMGFLKESPLWKLPDSFVRFIFYPLACLFFTRVPRRLSASHLLAWCQQYSGPVWCFAEFQDGQNLFKSLYCRENSHSCETRQRMYTAVLLSDVWTTL